MQHVEQHTANDEITQLKERIEVLEEALFKIESWSRAYPTNIFPEPDYRKAHKLLTDGGMTLDSISASCMRHALIGVGKIANEILEHDR